MRNKREIGSEHEKLAVEFLKDNGYIIHKQNFRSGSGEIDIIGENEGYICFIEVKYRASLKDGYPEEAVDFRKIQKISRTALAYLNYSKLGEAVPCRFDVVSILADEIKLIKNAFEMNI